MSKFVISTKKSLYGVIEIELDGQTYPVIVTSDVVDQISETIKDKKKVEDQPCPVLIDQLSIYTGAKKEIIKKLDIRDLKAAVEFINDQIAITKNTGESEEKNESTPADRK